MKYKIGDLVRFVDEPIEGHITSFQNNNIIGVTDDTGFEIPVLSSKVTLVHGNMQRDDDVEVEVEVKAVESTQFIEKGILLGISGDQKEGLAKLHIINMTSYELLVSISEVHNNKVKGIFAEKISKHSASPFFSANFSNVGNWPTFHFQILRHRTSPHKINEILDREQRIRPIDLTDTKHLNTTLGEKIWYYELDNQEEIGIDKLKSHFISNRPNKK